jgi:hypothetical protein
MPNRFALEDERYGGGGGNWFDDQAIVQPPSGQYPSAGNTGIAGYGTMPAAGPIGMGQAGPSVPAQQQGPSAYGNDYQAWFNALVQGRPFNQQTLLELEPVLEQYGMHLTPPNAAGDRTKIQLPDGTWVRVGFGEGRPVWVPQPGTGPGAGGAMSGGMGQPQVGGIGGVPPPFEAPSMTDFNAIPGLQSRYAMGLQGLERSAAAKGSLLSGGTQKAIARYGQDYASNEYGNLFNRALQQYQTNVGTQSELPWRRYQDLYQGGLQAILGSKTPIPLG